MAAENREAARTGGASANLFKSRLARRILLLFVLSVLIPLLVFAGLSLSQVSRQLEEQANARLHEACKTVGMSMVERLHHLRADLALLVDDSRDGQLGILATTPGVRERLQARYDWLALATADGTVLDATQADLDIPSFEPEQLEHLGTGSAALIFRDSEEQLHETLLVVAAGGTGDLDRIIVGRVSADHLWGGEWVQQPNIDVVVLTEDGSDLLFASARGSYVAEPTRLTAAGASAAGSFDWSGPGGSHLAHYRTMFTRPVFLNSFLVAISHPRSYVLAPIATFKTLFVLFGLVTLLAVVVASLLQIRRSLSPILSLQEGTLRVASGSSDEEVVIHTGDEFEDLARAFNSMAHGIRERTTELERANRAKSDFLAHMSHELRTPLTAVIGYTELSMAENVSDVERKRSLEVIHRNGDHLLQVVNTILDMSRVEAGEVVVEERTCDPVAITIEVMEVMEVLAREKGIELRVHLDPDVPTRITSDPTRLRQILVNVLGNGIKFTDSGHVEVFTEWRQAEGAGMELVYRILDTGPGIAADQTEAIFEPFHQADLSMSRRHGGTGIGLSLSRALARALGGDIVCRSELGAGSEFTVTIHPGEFESLPAPLPSQAQADSGGHVEPACEPRFVLLAEDVVLNRKMVAAMLKKGGHEIGEAENGRIACEMVEAAAAEGRPYDLIFMDMQMPEMDGYEATGWLRRSGYDLPIIALTAHSLAGECERCLDAGCDGYATKPITQAALLELVGRYAGTESGTESGSFFHD